MLGDTCIAPDYILVHHSVKEKFTPLLKNTSRSFMEMIFKLAPIIQELLIAIILND